MPKRGTNILLALTIIMLAGLLWSRALLSISMGFFVIYAVYYTIKNKVAPVKHPLFIWCLCPLVLLFAGIYQEGFTPINCQLLLTFLVYPVAGITAVAAEKFAFTKTLSQPWIHAALIALLYPIGWFVVHSTATIEQYGTGKSLPVFMDNDHLRFSIFLCSALLFTLLPVSNAKYKKISFAILLAAILFLSVRTAWVLAFIVIVGYGIYYFSIKQSYTKLLLLKTTIVLVVVLGALWVIPTAQQKIRYTIYDWQQYNTKGYDSNYSDGVRRAVNTAAWKAIQENKATAIGWSAIPLTIQQKFSKEFKGSTIKYGWPFNQWLFWWMGSGWWGALLFTIWFLYPAWYGIKHKNPFLIIWTLAIAFSCLVESTLNYQYGIFLHVWPLLVSWQTFKKSPQ